MEADRNSMTRLNVGHSMCKICQMGSCLNHNANEHTQRHSQPDPDLGSRFQGVIAAVTLMHTNMELPLVQVTFELL